MSVYLKLQPNDFADLLQLAARECRDVRAQATYIILSELNKQKKTPPMRELLTASATGRVDADPQTKREELHAESITSPS